MNPYPPSILLAQESMAKSSLIWADTLFPLKDLLFFKISPLNNANLIKKYIYIICFILKKNYL